MKQETDYTTEESIGEQGSLSFGKFSFSALAQSFSKKEEDLERYVGELKAKIKTLVEEKKEINANFRKESDFNKEIIRKNRESINKIDSTLEKLELKNISLTSNVKSQKVQNFDAFKIALKPLQDCSEIIEKGKISLAKYLDGIQLENNQFIIAHKEQQKELEKVEKEAKVLESELEKITEKVAEIKKSHFWDYKEVYEEDLILQELNEVKLQKKRNSEKIKDFDKEIGELGLECAKFAYENTQNPEKLIPELNRNEAEVEELEEYLEIQSKQYNCRSISEVSKKVALEKNNYIENNIMKIQVDLMENQLIRLIEASKIAEGVNENNAIEFDALTHNLEYAYFRSVSNGKADMDLEKQLQVTRSEIEFNKAEYLQAKMRIQLQIQIVQEWIDRNRKHLLVKSTETAPGDEEIIKEYLKSFAKLMKPNELHALQCTVSRYSEKCTEKNQFYIEIQSLLNKNSALALENEKNLVNLKASKKAKEIEYEGIKKNFKNLVKSEKILLNRLEKCKLEIESGRKTLENKLLSQIPAHRPRKSESEAALAKETLSKQHQGTISILKTLYTEEIRLKTLLKSLNFSVIPSLKADLRLLQEKISEKTSEILKVEDETIAIEDSIEQIQQKISVLAVKKKEEVILIVKKIARDHGGERTYKIDQLYKTRALKETEILEAEMKTIEKNKVLAEKELEKSLEILKLRTRLGLVEADLAKAKKNTLQKEKPKRKLHNKYSSLDLGAIEIIETPELDENHKESLEKIQKTSGKAVIHEANSFHSSSFLNKSCILLENSCDVSSELQYEQEIIYKIRENASVFEKDLFFKISPLLAGGVLYKKVSNKGKSLFDPLESSFLPPEKCGYVLKKFRLNKQLTKLEFRQIGKPGVDSSLMLDSLISVKTLKTTSEIIKSLKKPLNPCDSTLESLSKHSSTYRSMKNCGKIDYASTSFIAKSKEVSYFPFLLMQKSGKLELLADSLPSYSIFLNSLSHLLTNRKSLEKLKFKIIS